MHILTLDSSRSQWVRVVEARENDLGGSVHIFKNERYANKAPLRAILCTQKGHLAWRSVNMVKKGMFKKEMIMSKEQAAQEVRLKVHNESVQQFDKNSYPRIFVESTMGGLLCDKNEKRGVSEELI